MKRLLTLLLIAGTFFMSTSMYGQTQKDWALYVYLIGSDLESGSDAGSTDIQEMLDAQSTQFAHVVVLTGGADKDGWRVPSTYLIEDGVQKPLNFVPSSGKMTDPSSVTEFINWATTNYPSTSNMLTFWNHGGDIRGYGNDEITQTLLSIPQVASGIANSSYIMNGNFFDVIGFDACLMANLEAISALKDYAYYYVASEETEPGHGWNYTPIINFMNDDETLLGSNLGRVIVDTYKAHGIENETTGLTLGVMDNFYAADLERNLDDLINKIVSEGKYRSLQKARGKAEEYHKDLQEPEYSQDVVDLGDLMRKLKAADSSLAAEADSVLNTLSKMVVHNINDNTRPKASGISWYLPHNVLVDEDVTAETLQQYYNPLQSISSTMKNFISDTYITEVRKDNTPPSGEPDITFTSTPASTNRFNNSGRPLLNRSFGSIDSNFTTIRVTHDDDLEQVQLILMEEFDELPNEIVFLGSTYPDTAVVNDDGTVTYAYLFDDFWLSVNGYEAYVTDIQDYEVEDEEGNISYRTRIHIPAILNPGSDDERDINIEYSYDEDFNITLESIVPELVMVNDSVQQVQKERIFLKPGDEVQMLYESFNVITDEEFFVIEEDAIITIENGNQDLHLDYTPLPLGKYFLGWVLVDHSQNDTLIYDNVLYEIISSSTSPTFASSGIEFYPNPSNESITIEQKNFNGKEYEVRMYDQTGRLCFNQHFTSQKINIETAGFASGFYKIELISGSTIISDKLIIQH